MIIDQQTVYYIVWDDDDSKTGELGFVVLESPLDSRANTMADGLTFMPASQHREQYEVMTSGTILSDFSAYDVVALYAMSPIDVFAPGDTLRYTTAYVMMSPAERKQRLASGASAFTQYYTDAATRIRTWLADLPTSVDEEPMSDGSLIIAPHPVTDHWTIHAPAGTQWQIAIHAIDGQLIHRTVSHLDGTADGPELHPGVYHIIASSGEQNISRVIVRQP
ncbi:MAG: T9SS C-terminal target domain-containing protein [Ignavibacteriae bacterium]|nr:MAG: T9SS C-terminal target domain-containing protein [Ignavibacteriota bacterium]